MHPADHRSAADPAVPVHGLIGALVAGYLLQWAGELGLGSGRLEAALALTPEGWRAGEYWRLPAHGFVHSTTNLFHLALVLAAVAGPGRALARELGARVPLVAFAAGQGVGGLLWLGFRGPGTGSLTGSAAGAYALLAAWCLRHPRRPVEFLALFVLPIRLEPRPVLLALLGGEAFLLMIAEVLRRPLPFPYAAAAHLGGAIAGWLVLRAGAPRARDLPPAAARPPPVPEPAAPPAPAADEDRRAELDRILDKINREGLRALTPAERRTLEAARDLRPRR